MEFKTASEKLIDVLNAKKDKDETSLEVDQIVGSITDRVFLVIEGDLRDRIEIEKKKSIKIDQCWRNLAAQCVNVIVEAGSLAPGLSHQDIYVGELQAAAQKSADEKEFLAAIDAQTAKWGSRIKYPLYGGGRKKDLVNLKADFSSRLPEEKKSIQRSVESFFFSEREKLQEETDAKIDQSAIEFRGLLLDALKFQQTPDYIIQLRWFLIHLLTKKLFDKMNSKLGDIQSRYRDLIYLTFEKVLNKIYQSFQVFVNEVTRSKRSNTGNGLADIDLKALFEREMQRTNSMIAELETGLNSLQFDANVISLIKARLKAGEIASVSDPKVFVEVSAGLRTDSTFEQFVAHLKRATNIDNQQREEIITSLKTSVEPFRVMYYSKINFVRYLKGLTIFQAKI